MLRTSSYVIYVDLPGHDQELLLVHGYTGAYDKVTRPVETYLRSMMVKHSAQSQPDGLTTANREPAITLSDKTIEVLKRRGYLTEMTVDEEGALFGRLATRLHEAELHSMPVYMFMLTYDCNLRCPYCYQGHLRSDPQAERLQRVMTPELVDRILAALPGLELQHGISTEQAMPRDITFYGGEPLLERNHPIVEYIIHQALALGPAQFSAVSNGTDLAVYRDLLGPDKIASIQITLDGPPRIHDQRRIYADGRPSFERIASNITLALDLGVQIAVRMNVDRTNLAYLPELAEEMLSQDWDRYPNFRAYAAPVTAQPGNRLDKQIALSLVQLTTALTTSAQRYPSLNLIASQADSLESQIRQVFENQASPLPSFKTGYCGANGTAYIFDPYGDIYTCWDYTGDPSVRIGHLGSDGIVLNEQCQLWRSRTVLIHSACSKCPYALYCGGGCASQALIQHNDLFANHCDGFAAAFRANVAQAYLEHPTNIPRQSV